MPILVGGLLHDAFDRKQMKKYHPWTDGRLWIRLFMGLDGAPIKAFEEIKSDNIWSTSCPIVLQNLFFDNTIEIFVNVECAFDVKYVESSSKHVHACCGWLAVTGLSPFK